MSYDLQRNAIHELISLVKDNASPAGVPAISTG
jgi:hypothetical protein